MSRNNTLLLYGELGFLKVCVAPSEPFLSIPMVTASKPEEITVFGTDALEKDESWELIWLQDERTEAETCEAFYGFVLRQPEVLEAAETCKYLLVAIQYAFISDDSTQGGFFDYYSPLIQHYSPSLEHCTASEERLSVIGRQALGTRFALNISGDITSLRKCTLAEGYVPCTGFVKIGFDAIVNQFIKLLCEKGYDLTGLKGRLFCQELVLDYCYVALDLEKELERIENLDGPLHKVRMEDGSVLELGKECVLATEVLFNPRFIGMDEQSIMSVFDRNDFTGLPKTPPLILTGSCAPKLKGLDERIQQELETMDEKYVDDTITCYRTNIREDAVRYSRMFANGSIDF
mmetsp:Transcript_14889/g.18042  ORF Transcript_14889/g.18042 Transcript_14889/m.18042 type:complete len:347 (+) Transcript_14889:75-1115(+)